jgi:hypothetical protein
MPQLVERQLVVVRYRQMVHAYRLPVAAPPKTKIQGYRRTAANRRGCL